MSKARTRMVLLQTDRLTLRQFTGGDCDNLLALDNDPEVMRYINGGTPVPREAIERAILPVFMRRDPQHPDFGFWAAESRTTSEFLGWFSLRLAASDSSTATLGYRLRRKMWGRGYASEGAAALVDLAFAKGAVMRVAATTYEHNIASRRVMEKIGMTLVRTFRLTAEELMASDTHHVEAPVVWAGNDVEYALERAVWAAGDH